MYIYFSYVCNSSWKEFQGMTCTVTMYECGIVHQCDVLLAILYPALILLHCCALCCGTYYIYACHSVRPQMCKCHSSEEFATFLLDLFVGATEASTLPMP